MVTEDALATFTAAGSVACPEGDFSRSAPVYNNTVASGCIASIMGVAASIHTSGGSIYAASSCSTKVMPGVTTTTGHAAMPTELP
jgi:hypothetical protein